MRRPGTTIARSWPTDMAHNLNALVERGGDASSKQLRDFLAEGSKTTAVRYLAARDEARRYEAGIVEIFKEYDAIITPASPGVAPKGMATGNPAFCSLWTLTGLPALSLPILTGEGGMPLGVQLIGERGDDARLLRTANWLVEELARKTRRELFYRSNRAAAPASSHRPRTPITCRRGR